MWVQKKGKGRSRGQDVLISTRVSPYKTRRDRRCEGVSLHGWIRVKKSTVKVTRKGGSETLLIRITIEVNKKVSRDSLHIGVSLSSCWVVMKEKNLRNRT